MAPAETLRTGVSVKKITLSVASLVLVMSGISAAVVSKEDVKKLLSAGIQESVIVQYVKAHRPVDPLSPDDIQELKAAGATNSLLSLLLSEAGPEREYGSSSSSSTYSPYSSDNVSTTYYYSSPYPYYYPYYPYYPYYYPYYSFSFGFYPYYYYPFYCAPFHHHHNGVLVVRTPHSTVVAPNGSTVGVQHQAVIHQQSPMMGHSMGPVLSGMPHGGGMSAHGGGMSHGR